MIESLQMTKIAREKEDLPYKTLIPSMKIQLEIIHSSNDMEVAC